MNKTLKQVIELLDNKQYDVIEERLLFEYEDNMLDTLFGYCKLIDGELISLDGDSYSLNDLCLKWEENIVDGELWLTVWVATNQIV